MKAHIRPKGKVKVKMGLTWAGGGVGWVDEGVETPRQKREGAMTVEN